MKRGLDVLLSTIGLLLLWPAIAAASLAIIATSPGPAIFRQTRVGRHERPFTCYKLRTMKVDTPNLATHQVGRSAVTPVGAFLRRTKADELPQLWNVLKGDMSLVGPRPCLPEQHELIARRRAYRVFSVRPGITGIAQIQAVDMSDPERLAQLDQAYLASKGVREDLRILLRTLIGGGSGDRIKQSP